MKRNIKFKIGLLFLAGMVFSAQGAAAPGPRTPERLDSGRFSMRSFAPSELPIVNPAPKAQAVVLLAQGILGAALCGGGVWSKNFNALVVNGTVRGDNLEYVQAIRELKAWGPGCEVFNIYGNLGSGIIKDYSAVVDSTAIERPVHDVSRLLLRVRELTDSSVVLDYELYPRTWRRDVGAR